MNIRIGKHTIKGIGLLMMALMLLAACGSETEADSQQDTDDISVDDMNDAIDELEDIAEEAEAEAEEAKAEEEAEADENEPDMDATDENRATNYSYTMISYSKVGDGPGQTSTTEVYVKGAAYYILTDDIGYFYHPDDQSTGMYSVEDNSVVIMADDAVHDQDDYITPWDTASEIEEDMYSDEFYVGEEELNGVMTRKYVYPLGDTLMTAYYDTNNSIVAKLQYEVDDTITYIEYQNYEEGTVTDADISYPESAEIIDWREMGIE